ncbi:TetR family transcriptional regulator [Halopseudomonas oceani]|uniref:TetR family transcriptional regulator n=1 Tax=Halopseudomonas oceani TaxID=1708783 RepID=A0A2P4EZY4_9GAMM|nr:TetR/AcrR family transcriptional regulator [Halopseudomonas oceani]POB06296.1 TetR family transcriptional regulator [Halopseudomonas oceani]GGE36572.1 TetR family transcriptional regulator [Halopseudomonas oceani]
MKTRDRILEASLQLFNEQGERAVTTNHIAAHLGMSPGNLYYHFRNKQQIIAELFDHYERELEDSLALPADRGLDLDDKARYVESLSESLWRYRFLQRDLEHLLASDAQVAERYRLFSRRALQAVEGIFQGTIDAGILDARYANAEVLALNSWLLMNSWTNFLCTTVLTDPQVQLTPQMQRRAVYQVLAQELGLLSDAARPRVEAMLRDYYTELPDA